jgi:hypothetical protein
MIFELLVKPGLSWQRERLGMAAVQAASDSAALAAHLGHASARVRAAASAALARRPCAEAVAALRPALRDAPRAWEAGLLAVRALATDPANRSALRELLAELAGGEQEGLVALVAQEVPGVEPEGELLTDLANDERPRVRLAVARGLLRVGAEPSRTAQLLVDLLGDASLETPLRVEALDSTDPPGVDRAHLRALAQRLGEPLLAALDAGRVTPELLWVVAEHGGPQHALRATAVVGHDEPTVADAALEALEGILSRGVDLGPTRAAIRDALAAVVRRLREEHPKGSNSVADQIVSRAEGVERALSDG